MAARFWVGGTGNWDAADTTHWAATSGGAGGASVPGASDDVTFDTNSGAGATVTVTANYSVASVTINKSDLTLTHSATSTTSGNMTLTTGILNTNGQACQWSKLDSGNSSTRTITLGASVITLTANGSGWDTSPATNLTFNANTSELKFTGNNAEIHTSSLTFYKITFNSNGNQIFGSDGVVNLTDFTMTGTAQKTGNMTFNTGGNAIVVAGTFTVTPNSSVNRILLKSQTLGTAQTITYNGATNPNTTISSTDFRDISIGGSFGTWDLSAITGGSGDAGGNSNATFTQPLDLEWNSSSGGNWSSSSWTSKPYLVFDGTNDDVTISDNADLRPNTFSAYYKAKFGAAPVDPDDFYVLQKRGGPNVYNWYMNIETTSPAEQKFGCSFVDSSGSSHGIHSNDGTVMVPGVTYDVVQVVSLSGSTYTIKMYVNGVLQTATLSWSNNGASTSNPGVLAFGDDLGSGQAHSNMTLYDVRFFSGKSLTQEEVTALHNGDDVSGVTSHWDFSDGSGTTLTDIVSGYNGTITGATWTTTDRVPLPQDNAFLGTSFSASQTVTADMPRLAKNISWSGVSGSPTFSLGLGVTNYGSIKLSSGITFSGSQIWTWEGRSSFLITSSGKSFPNQLVINAFGGTLTLQDALTTTSTISLTTGTLTNSSYDVSTAGFVLNGTSTRALNMGSGTWTLTGTGTQWNATATGITLSSGTSTIFISNTSASSKTFAGAGLTYNDLKIAGGGAGAIIITGANTFNRIYTDGGGTKSITLPGSTTTTILLGQGLGNGTNVITFTASAGSATLLKANGTVAWDYVNLTNIVGDNSGGTLYYAGPLTHSTDGGGNTNWSFTQAPNIGGSGLQKSIALGIMI